MAARCFASTSAIGTVRGTSDLVGPSSPETICFETLILTALQIDVAPGQRHGLGGAQPGAGGQQVRGLDRPVQRLCELHDLVPAAEPGSVGIAVFHLHAPADDKDDRGRVKVGGAPDRLTEQSFGRPDFLEQAREASARLGELGSLMVVIDVAYALEIVVLQA